MKEIFDLTESSIAAQIATLQAQLAALQASQSPATAAPALPAAPATQTIAATSAKVVFPKHARLDGPKSFTNWLRQLRLALPNQVRAYVLEGVVPATWTADQLAARDDAARELIVGSIDSADVSATLDAIPSDCEIKYLLHVLLVSSLPLWAWSLHLGQVRAPDFGWADLGPAKWPHSGFSPAQATSWSGLPWLLAQPSYQCGHLRARPSLYFFTLRNMSDAGASAPEAKLREPKPDAPPLRPPTHSVAFATTELLRNSSGYRDWVLAIRSRLPSGVVRYLNTGVPLESWPASYVPLWDHYACSSICASVDSQTVLPGLSPYLDESLAAPKVWQALRERYGTVSAVDLLPVIQRLFSSDPVPVTPDLFLQFRDSFENDARLLQDSRVTVNALLASHLLARLPSSFDAWRTTFVAAQGDSTAMPSATEIFTRLYRDVKARPVDTPVAAVATPQARHGCSRPCPNPSCRKLHWLRECPDTAWAAAYRARRTAEKKASQPVAPPTPCTPKALLAIPASVSLLTLHRRLAHLPVAQIKNIVQSGLVTGVDWVYKDQELRDFYCNACLASKAHALPFARSKSIASGRLDLLHVDVAQMPRPTFGGHRYMLVIIDDFSRKHWCILLALKSDVFPRLRDWILEVENATGNKVKTIRSDNEGEFTLRNFVDFCASKGIRRELTIPYTPQQNGRVERSNRTIKEGILALLYSSGADSRLWGEAALYYVHCKNLMPHAGIGGEIPDTRWHGFAPDISTLRAFGCRAWHHLPSAKCTDLDPKAVPLLFVGFDQHAKAFRLFEPSTRRIQLSRNVVFRESEFPALRPATDVRAEPIPLPVTVDAYPDQVDPLEPSLVASPRSLAPRAEPPRPVPAAPDQGPHRPAPAREVPDQDSLAPPAPDQGSPARELPDPESPASSASDQGSSDSAISTPCPSPRPVASRALPAPPSPARSDSPDPIDLLPRPRDVASLCQAQGFPDDVDDALHSPSAVAYLASGAAALIETSPVDPAELIAPARDPPHWRAAMATPQADEWRLAARDEFDSLLRDFSAFTPIDESLVPADAKVLGSRFVFRTKRDQHGQVKSYKGRLVARGDSQRSGIDFDETFAPVAKFTSIRALLALAAAHGYHVHQADIDKAYLHGKLDAPLYIRVPDGIYMPGKVLQLHRSLYGLRQAGRIWNDEIDSALSALGYVATGSDHCVYVRTTGDVHHYIALYVDDLLMISPSLPEIERTLQGLEQRYGVKRLGEAEYVLGIQIRRSPDGSISLSQEQYLKDVLARFGMSDAHPVATPMQPDLRLEVELQPTPFPDRTRYLQAIGSLMYASTGTRPCEIKYLLHVLLVSSLPLWAWSLHLGQVRAPDFGWADLGPAKWPHSGFSPAQATSWSGLPWLLAQPSYQCGHLRARPSLYFFTLRNMSDAGASAPEAKLREPKPDAPPLRPPTHSVAFATTELLRNSSGYRDWVLAIRSRLPSGVVRYLNTGVPLESWPASYVPLWDHYACSSICASVDSQTVLPGLSPYLDESLAAPKVWQALRERYGTVSAVDLLPVIQRLFSSDPVPVTPDLFLQFRDSFENDARLLQDSRVTVNALLASHLLARLPSSFDAWRTTFVAAQGDSTAMPSATEIFTRLYRDVKARPVDTPVAAVATPQARHGCSRPCPNPSCRKLHWLRECPDTAWAAAYRARRTAEKKASQPVAPPTPCTPKALLAIPASVSLLTLHRRLAHLPVAQIKNIVQSGLVTGVDWVYKDQELRDFYCNACLASKAHALPFARSKSIASGRLDLLHVDVAQMPRPTFGGHRYMLVIIDDFSRKHWCILLALKSDVFPRLRDWILEVENATGNKVKTIRSDNGGEFTLRNFVDFCASKGIRRELTIPYTPQQNGRVERSNRTIKEGILALLYSSGADSRLWGEAALYYVHCKNLMPHAGIGGEIPDTRWHGFAPDISTLRAFGCRAWHHLPSAKRTDLDPKAVPLLFVGFDQHAKAFRLFEPSTRRIQLSRSQPSYQCGYLRARPSLYFFTLRNMSDAGASAPEAKLRGPTPDAPPLRPPTHSAAFATTELLRNSSGYRDWVLAIRSRLPSGVVRYLNTGVPLESWPASYVPLWDHYACSSICASVDSQTVLPGLSPYLDESLAAPKVWQALRERYGTVSAVDLLPVIQRLFSSDPVPITPDLFLQFRDSFENDARLLQDSQVTVNALLASHLLARLPSSFDAWRTTFVADQGDSTAMPSATEIFTRLYRDVKARPVDTPVAAVATPQARHGCSRPCPNPSCRKLHWLRECPDTAWAAAYRARRTAEKKASQPVTSPAAVDTPNSVSFTACLLATPSPFRKSSWLLDSGANRHMTNDRGLFSELRTVAGPRVGGVAGSLPSTGCGTICIQTSTGPITVSNVLLVPDLPCNLLSVFQLDQLGYRVSFASRCASIARPSGAVVATAQAIGNNLYALALGPTPCTPKALLAIPTKVSLLTLHRRLAHLPVVQIKNIVQKGLVTGVDWVYKDQELRDFYCNACLASKAHALPFARSKSIASGRLDLLHVDVAQMPRPTFGGHRYMLVIIDDFSRKHWCLLLALKSDVFPRLRDWILEVENATGNKVKTIRSDNGGEFTLRNFVDFCASKGIRRELTIPYTPQQNGRVERSNRTIKEGILALLYSSGADSRLWGEAALYYVHCKNLMPHAGIGGEIPDTRWHGFAPDISTLRAFGCRAWHHLPSAKRTDLDPKAVPLLFVGFDHHAKAFRLFEPSTRRIQLSRNVVFRESEFPALRPATDVRAEPIPLPVTVDAYPDQVDPLEPSLVASPRSLAPRADQDSLAPPAPDQGWQATSSSEDVDYTRRRGSGRRKVDWAAAGDRGTTEEGTRLRGSQQVKYIGLYCQRDRKRRMKVKGSWEM
ncbi:BQ5605_C071g12878 [Microbotryum silenes-dioicae]|uniref:BQ5605_C071g12878 protein n=1 Tax=Microbotryum silenes-dioicae TaxID=796604 RepID=A0A2X0MUB0_9BASI|nr:BQ5605_C071g12878 [Microbotryum silenes-dioicae]